MLSSLKNSIRQMEKKMKFCPMCGMSQPKAGATACEYCDYKEKPIEELIRSIYEGVEMVSDVKQFPIVVLNTQAKGAKIITREGASQ